MKAEMKTNAAGRAVPGSRIVEGTPPSMLGKIVFAPDTPAAPEIICQEGPLRRHAKKPWMRAHIAQQIGREPAFIPASGVHAPPTKGSPAEVPDGALARHVLIGGSSGGGKSMLCECLFENMLERGQSCLALDPKPDTISRLVSKARKAGLAPDQITVISPRAPFIPGFNPFLTDIPTVQAATDFFALIQQNAPSWGVRLGDLLTNACILAAAHRLSPFEMVEALRREGYAEALLKKVPAGLATAAYDESVDFFRTEFLTLTRAVRSEAVNAVTNKTREVLRNDFLRALLCAQENTLRLSELWERQQVVLVHLDRASLGEQGARLLGSLMAMSLYRTALRSPGTIPVNLILDELATIEHFVGDILIDIATTARSYHIRLVAACQHLAALSPPLRAALLGNTAVQAFCRLGSDDARLAATFLSAGTPPRLVRLYADVAERNRRTGQPTLATCKHIVRDAAGLPLRVSPAAWERLRWDGLFGDGALTALFKITASSKNLAGAGRLYVRAADTGRSTELRRYVVGLSPEEFWLEGPSPLTLIVGFPKPRLSGAQRTTETDAARGWTRALLDMPQQHAVLKVAGEAPVIMRVTDMDAPLSHNDTGRLLAQAARANGQSRDVVAETARWRRAQVAQAISGSPALADEARSSGNRPCVVDAKGSRVLAGRDGQQGRAGVNVLRTGGFADDGSLA